MPVWVGCCGCPLGTSASSVGGPGRGWRDGSVCAGVCHLESEPAHCGSHPPPPDLWDLCPGGLSLGGSVKVGVCLRVKRGEPHFSELLRQLLHWIWEKYKPPSPNYLTERVFLGPHHPGLPPACQLSQGSGLPYLPFSFPCTITSPASVRSM